VRWLIVSVAGPSMVPTLRDGDCLLARRGARIHPGDLVLARFADLDRLVVKRAVRPVGGGWYVASDNPYAGGDSATHGPAQVLARVVWRYWPPLRW
jgi:phage repressor protein C with HTH and peptisase S24 domain